MLAIDMEVCCGQKSIPWDVFLCVTTDQLGSWCLLPTRFHGSMPTRLQIQRRIREQDAPCTLRRFLEYFLNSVSSDRRDKIFGLLGVAGDCLLGQLEADYSKSVYEVYQEASEFLRARSIYNEYAAVSTLVYSSLGSPLPHPDTFGTYGIIENSYHVIGHIVAVSRREDLTQHSLNSTKSDWGTHSLHLTALCLPSHFVDQILSLHIPSEKNLPGMYEKETRMILSWSPLFIPRMPLPYARQSNPNQENCSDHWPLFLDSTVNGRISQDILTATCYLFVCKRWIYVNVEAKEIEVIPEHEALLSSGITLCPDVT